MKFVALVSGGKDSIYSIMECLRHGHKLVACVHLGRPTEEEEESYMYQTAASEAVAIQVEECLGVPLVLYTRQGRSVNTSLVYEGGGENGNAHETTGDAQSIPALADEVEDLFQALVTAKERFPEVTAVSSGAILSTYQRVRIENVCSRLGLTSLSFLWRRSSQSKLLHSMLEDQLTAVLVRTAAPPGLLPRRHLNRTLQELQQHFEKLYDKYQFHVCGEGGEYETLVLDCPIFQKRLVLDETTVVETNDDEGVGVLHILSCHAETKSEAEQCSSAAWKSKCQQSETLPPCEAVGHVAPSQNLRRSLLSMLPRVCTVSGGLYHCSEISSPRPAQSMNGESEADLAVQEAIQVFELLRHTLQRLECTPQDVLMVHLYLSQISHFGRINQHYRDLFGTLLPPSRSCVAVGPHALPGGRRVQMDCLVQSGSGAYLRLQGSDLTKEDQAKHNPYTQAAMMTKTSQLRQVLHVQSRSHWAPVCVGPYSQVNSYRSQLHFVAGQIGLVPATMQLRGPSWKEQLQQAWINAASILDALDEGTLCERTMSGLVYIADSLFVQDDCPSSVASISYAQLQSNGGIVPGAVIGTPVTDDTDGYEDEETRLALSDASERSASPPPLLLVSIPEMPVGALVEVEIVAATREAMCLTVCDSSAQRVGNGSHVQAPRGIGWDTGHDFDADPSSVPTVSDFVIDTRVRAMGKGACASFAVVTATPTDRTLGIHPEAAFQGMLQALKEENFFDTERVLHLRLFYVASHWDAQDSSVVVHDDGVQLRMSFAACVAQGFSCMPATSVVPVRDMRLLDGDHSTSDTSEGSPIFALQAMALDPVKNETCMWIRQKR